MISDEIIIKELLKFKKPDIDELMLQIKSKASKLPSDSQLQKFKSIVLNRTINNISKYLQKREKVSGSEKWLDKVFPANKSFKNLILEVIIRPVEKTDKIDPDSTLWGIDFTEFIRKSGLAGLNIDIEIKYKEMIIRKIIAEMIDEIKIKRSLNL